MMASGRMRSARLVKRADMPACGALAPPRAVDVPRSTPKCNPRRAGRVALVINVQDQCFPCSAVHPRPPLPRSMARSWRRRAHAGVLPGLRGARHGARPLRHDRAAPRAGAAAAARRRGTCTARWRRACSTRSAATWTIICARWASAIRACRGRCAGSARRSTAARRPMRRRSPRPGTGALAAALARNVYARRPNRWLRRLTLAAYVRQAADTPRRTAAGAAWRRATVRFPGTGGGRRWSER